MNIALYARVSTDEQKPDLQLLELRRFAEARKFMIVQEFVDVGHSGAKASRPQLDALMDGARKRRFDGVLVWKFDRLARSVDHLRRTLLEFRKLGIEFLSYTENLDTSTPMGEAMFSIMGAMAQLERDLIRERTVAGLRAAKARGVRLGGKPLGLEAQVLRLRNEGRTFREIATTLGVSIAYAHKA